MGRQSESLRTQRPQLRRSNTSQLHSEDFVEIPFGIRQLRFEEDLRRADRAGLPSLSLRAKLRGYRSVSYSQRDRNGTRSVVISSSGLQANPECSLREIVALVGPGSGSYRSSQSIGHSTGLIFALRGGHRGACRGIFPR